MKTIRAILSGVLVWAFIFSAFVAISFIPVIKDSELLQGLIIGAFIIPFASLGAAFYYKSGARTDGFMLGLFMISIALILDALITVPYIEIPYKGSSYSKFFTSTLLWTLVVENVAVIYFYWQIKVKPSAPNH